MYHASSLPFLLLSPLNNPRPHTRDVCQATPVGPAVAGRRLCRPPPAQLPLPLLLAPAAAPPPGLPALPSSPDPATARTGGLCRDSALTPPAPAPLGPGQWPGRAATRLAPLRVWWVLRSVAGRVVAVGSMR